MYNHGSMAHTHFGDETTATTLLQGAGLRLTPQRLAIAREVLTQDHPTAAEVYEAVRVRFPTMGLATVYATLNVMVERGLLRPLAFENVIVILADYEIYRHLQYDVALCCGLEGWAFLLRDGQIRARQRPSVTEGDIVLSR